MKKAKDMSKLHENKESTMQEGKETKMEKEGYKETESGKMVKSAKGGLTKSQKKIGSVMRRFKKDKLKSSSGKKVTNRKQAIAIALSEAGQSKMKKASEGSMIEESKSEEKPGQVFKDLIKSKFSKSSKKRGGGMAERGMGQAFSKGGAVRGTGAAIRGTRPAKLY
jgi:hypothetical protein